MALCGQRYGQRVHDDRLYEQRAQETEAYIAWLVVRSRRFVCSEVHWPQIEAVARELLAKPKGERRLSARQVREICRRVKQGAA
jgi:hypothetical protein